MEAANKFRSAEMMSQVPNMILLLVNFRSHLTKVYLRCPI